LRVKCRQKNHATPAGCAPNDRHQRDATKAIARRPVMKHSNDKTALVLELDAAELATIHGGADKDAPKDPTEPGYWIEMRNNALVARDTASSLGWQGAVSNPAKIVEAYFMDVQARKDLQMAAENLNHIAQRHEEARQQARDADARELAELEAENDEAEDDRLIQEAEDMLRESNGGGDGGTPGNQESYSGEQNASFPSYMVNPTSSGEAQISTEQVGPDEFPGGSYSGEQNQETRLY
jgi:hypothetical protein